MTLKCISCPEDVAGAKTWDGFFGSDFHSLEWKESIARKVSANIRISTAKRGLTVGEINSLETPSVLSFLYGFNYKNFDSFWRHRDESILLVIELSSGEFTCTTLVGYNILPKNTKTMKEMRESLRDRGWEILSDCPNDFYNKRRGK